MKKITLADVAASITVLALVAFTLMPAVARMQRSTAEARCQSNLQRWAEAMELYTADNYGRYPTNRYKSMALNSVIPLSQPDPLQGEDKQPRFQYGPNWVEALYTYVKSAAARTGQDWKSLRCCPNATNNLYPPRPTSGADLNWAMTYVFNGALVEQSTVTVRDAKKLMMIRELGRLTVSTVRPSNGWSCVGNTSVPMNPFLNNADSMIGNTSMECKLHGDGSYILFADGHVRHLTVDFYPDQAQITAARCYDFATSQWWNFAPGSGAAAPYLKSIAITP